MCVRIELGPKDMATESVMTVRRDNGHKEAIAWKDLQQRMPAVLQEMQAAMFDRASARVQKCMATVRLLTSVQLLASVNKLAPFAAQVDSYVFAGHMGSKCAMRSVCKPSA